MDNPNSIGRVIKALLLESKDVARMTGGRVFPIVALVQNPIRDTPCVVYTKTGLTPAGVKEFPSYGLASVTVSAVARSYQDMVALSGAVLNALAEKSGDIEGKSIKRIAWRDARDNYEDGMFIQEMDFEIKMRMDE